MVLDELHELIETLQARIDQHAAALQQSEALTRYALIDPMLRALGWDTGDPSQVLVEVRFGSGSADYALLGGDGRHRVIVEAKKLGTPLQSAVNQGINYSIEDGILHFALTDGQRWELYETHRPVPLAEKLVVKLDVNGPISQTCLDALALWRPSVETSQVRGGATPITEVRPPVDINSDLPVTTSRPEPQPVPEERERPRSRRKRPTIESVKLPSQSAESPLGWQRLSELGEVTGISPRTVRMPTGNSVDSGKWSRVAISIMEWLCNEGHLTEDHLPITTRSGRRIIVASTPNKPDGKSFVGIAKIEAPFPLYLEKGVSAKALVENARNIIERAGLNPADFAVKLQD